MSQITTHLLDTTLGKPASGVTIILYNPTGHSWEEVCRGKTNAEGRIPDLLPTDRALPPGTYKMRFETQPYFDNLGIKTFYPFVEIVFQTTDQSHYHIPLLLNPFGYSTYRGS